MPRKYKSKRKAKMASEINSNPNEGNQSVMNPSPVRKSGSANLKIIAATASQKTLETDTAVPDDWEDRDEADVEDDNENIICDLLLQPSLSLSSSTSRQKTVITSSDIVFPSEIWYLLGDYITPREVGKFASICKTSYSVVCSQGFWRRLYSRYYNPYLHADLLPDRLQPHCVSRPRGLRAAVIRALHLIYPPFLGDTGSCAVWPDPHLLTGTTCVLQSSHRLGSKAVHHYFKLKDTSPMRRLQLEDCCSLEDEGWDTRALVAELSDIHHNPEAGCRVLQVTAADWSSLGPAVMGQRLVSVSLSVALGMRFHKLKLRFDSGTEILIDSVVGVKIFNWWQSQYYQWNQ